MRLIPFEAANGDTVYINPKQVTGVCSDGIKRVRICCAGDPEGFVVGNKIDIVIARLEDRPCCTSEKTDLMNLRDGFAMAALASFRREEFLVNDGFLDCRSIAIEAYDVADAVMEERGK